jgi:hypothetical protein
VGSKAQVKRVTVDGIISRRDQQPYIKLAVDGMVAQCSMAEARQIARDIEKMCSRTEADAMIYKFFAAKDYPEGAATALVLQFREFRSKLDAWTVDHEETTPSEDPRAD